jgi:C4-dicarboxylate-specific signal transduction histidine kinase
MLSFEPLLAFLLLLHLQKTLKTFSPNPAWSKMLAKIIYAIIALVILESVFRIMPVTKWIWHFALLLIIAVPFRLMEFYPARTTMFAVMPLIFLSLISDVIIGLQSDLDRIIHTYQKYAFPVAFTWMIALLILSHKQIKALKKERKIRLEQEERTRVEIARKAELEQLIAERTTEILIQKEELEKALDNLKATQAQLIQKEKMASLGELTAGIAHEIKNPLNFINNFSEVNTELIAEMQHEIDNGNITEVKKIAKYIEANSSKITHHGKLADAIVKSMLQHSKGSTGTKEPIDINALADEYLRLSYHGLRAKDKTFNATLKTNFDDHIGKVEVVPQDIGRVLLNLYNNAFYSVTEKKKQQASETDPTVSVRTAKTNGKVEIAVRDNGIGIAQSIVDKIYQPFFTTKPTGQGTGLGLSLSYDIIKTHGGELNVKTKEGEFAEFVIQLPV